MEGLLLEMMMNGVSEGAPVGTAADTVTGDPVEGVLGRGHELVDYQWAVWRAQRYEVSRCEVSRCEVSRCEVFY